MEVSQQLIRINSQQQIILIMSQTKKEKETLLDYGLGVRSRQKKYDST
jgi:hypothetical protein